MYEPIITMMLIMLCAVCIAYISYAFGKTMRTHEDKLEGLSKDIDRHERDIIRIDKALIEHINNRN